MFENRGRGTPRNIRAFCNRNQWDAMRQRARHFVATKRGSQTNVYLYDPVYHSLLQHNETVNAA
jgi:hypothetical protein